MFSIIALLSCKKEISKLPPTMEGLNTEAGLQKAGEKTNTFSGPQTQMGNGKARSFFILSGAGKPVELGVELTADAFSGLAAEGHVAYQLPLHHKAQDLTAFNHIVVNWNPDGHGPLFLFGKPHFDFHFFTISTAAQLAIPAYTPGSMHDILPAAPYRPLGFVPTPGGEVEMGKHWADIIHPVIPGNFTHTMIYGSYNGAMIFVEPMITVNYLQSLTQKVSIPYNQPMQYMESNTWYPTVYNMYTNEAKTKYYVTLSNFIKST